MTENKSKDRKVPAYIIIVLVLAVIIAAVLLFGKKGNADGTPLGSISANVAGINGVSDGAELTEDENAGNAQTQELLAETPDPEKWKNAYRELLLNVQAEFPKFDENLCSYIVCDIDENGVPEIILKIGSCEADYKLYFYTYSISTGSVFCFHSRGGGHTSLCPLGDNRILLIYGHMGHEIVSRAEYKDNIYSEIQLTERDTEEYISLKYFESFGLSDYSGLDWTENPKTDNSSVLSGLTNN